MIDTQLLLPGNQDPTSGRPTDLEHDAIRRLKLLCIVSAAGGAAFFVVSWLVPWSLAASQYAMQRVMTPAFVVVALVVWLAVDRGRLAPATILDLGLGFEVLGAAALALGSNARPWPDHFALGGWSAVAVWVLLFPAVVPTSVGRTAVASVASASMDPLAVWLLSAADVIDAPAATLVLQRFLPNLVAVIAAVFLSRTLFELGTKLSAARAMGSYRLEERLGQGGMGEVWSASHGLLARPAAVKIIRHEQAGGSQAVPDTTIRRFEREVKATAALRSPHTIIVYDYGVAPEQGFYYVMELLNGIDFHTLVMKHGRQPAGRVVHLLRQACHSLHEAHEHGLVHRDIKPANLMTCRYGIDVDFVKVLDFGLVKGDAPGTEHLSLTREGALTGTPAFMPPEIARGQRNIDGRADIYGLGCIAYWLLTGKLVFDLAPSMKMVMRHAKEMPELPSQRGKVSIPPELELLVMRCLAKDPNDRPSTAQELRALLADTGVEAHWTEVDRRSWWDLHYPMRTA